MTTDTTTEAPAEAPKPKPPTQGVGVVGIEDIPIVLTPEKKVNWHLVGSLPPFQMYVASLVPVPADRDSQTWAIEYATRTGAQRGDEALLNAYCEWHAAKGYWPKESPFGELLPEGAD